MHFFTYSLPQPKITEDNIIVSSKRKMPNLSTRSYKKELLDADHIPLEDLQRNLVELNVINTYLGGHAITLKGIKKILAGKEASLEPIHIVEIGCGGGDNLAYLQKKLKGNFQFTGIDLKDSCIAFAREQYPTIHFVPSDYRLVAFDAKPHIIFSSLFCHHFTDEELVFQFNWLKEHVQYGFVINDLERNKLAYHLIKKLTRFFSSSYLVKNDAPLSVARGFHHKELKALLRLAGVEKYSLEWEWAFRYLIVSTN